MYELCGRPPLLATEEEKDFVRIANGIIEFVEPTNAIEWLYANDAVCYAFEIRRYRRIKVGLMERYNIPCTSAPKMPMRKLATMKTAMINTRMITMAVMSWKTKRTIIEYWPS